MAEFREDWGMILLPFLSESYEQHKRKHKDYVATLFNVNNSKKAVEIHQGDGELGLMRPWTETGRRVNYDDDRPGFKTVFEHQKYSNGMRIEREMWEDDQTGRMKSRTKKLARSVWYTRQFHGASVFNGAFTGRLGADGKTLCAQDKPVAPESEYTYTNAKTDFELNSDNLEQIRTEMMEWTDDRGNILVMNPDTLIVPPALREAALVIAGSDKKPDTDENNVNIWKGNINVIEYPFLRNPKAWFVVDSERMSDYLIWYDKRKAVLEADREDFDTEVSKYKVVSSFSYGWTDGRWIYGCIEKDAA